MRSLALIVATLIALILIAKTPASATEQIEIEVGNVAAIPPYAKISFSVPEGAWTVRCTILDAQGNVLAAEEAGEYQPIIPPGHSIIAIVGDRAGEAKTAKCLARPFKKR